jgi:hypothetical protein
METYTKISETKAQIITPQPDKIEVVELDTLNKDKQMLNGDKQMLQNQMDFLIKQGLEIDDKIKNIDDKIVEIKKLGVKTQVELEALIKPEEKPLVDLGVK